MNLPERALFVVKFQQNLSANVYQDNVDRLLSMELIHLVRNNLGKPYEDLEFLLGCLKEVMIESGEEKLATQIPWMNTIGESQIDSFSGKLLQLYSVCF